MDTNKIQADEFAESHLHDRPIEDDLQPVLEYYIQTHYKEPKLDNWLSAALRDFIVGHDEAGVSRVEIAALIDQWLKERGLIIPNHGVILRNLSGIVEASYQNYREIKKNQFVKFDVEVTRHTGT